MNETLKIIETIKNRSGIALAQALNDTGARACAEKNLADAWLAALRRHTDLHEDGWYMPPPHGVITLFGKPADRYQRICQSSFRPPSMWPSADIFCDEDDMVAAYASPVHRDTRLIGDFGLTVYHGKDAALREHCEVVLKTSLNIASRARVGMPLRELYALGMQQGAAQGFINDIASPSDATGTNMGHTIPLSWPGDPAHAVVAHAKTFSDIGEALRTGRKFVNAAETQRIEENMAFTVEPRFSTATLPQTWFHLTVIFENGESRICHGFTPVFQKYGMERLLKLLP